MGEKDTGKGAGVETGLSEKEGFHDETVIPAPDITGDQKPLSAPSKSAPGGHTIK